MKILSSFTHPQVVPNLYECLFFCWTQRKIFWKMWETEQFWGTIDFHSIFFPTMEVNGAPKQPGYKLSSKYLPLCSAEQRNSYRFGTTWGWVNDDWIFIFRWTIPLKGSYDVISSFPFLLQAICAYIRSLKLQRLKSQNQRDIRYKRLCHALLKRLIQTRPHMSTSLCGEICITPPKCIRKERRRNYYSRCSIVAAAGAMSWRRCVLLWKRKYFVWASKRGHN